MGSEQEFMKKLQIIGCQLHHQSLRVYAGRVVHDEVPPAEHGNGGQWAANTPEGRHSRKDREVISSYSSPLGISAWLWWTIDPRSLCYSTGFDVGSGRQKIPNLEVNTDVSHLPGFTDLQWLMPQYADMPQIYLLLMSLLLGQSIEQVPKSVQFDLNMKWTLICGIQASQPTTKQNRTGRAGSGGSSVHDQDYYTSFSYAHAPRAVNACALLDQTHTLLRPQTCNTAATSAGWGTTVATLWAFFIPACLEYLSIMIFHHCGTYKPAL